VFFFSTMMKLGLKPQMIWFFNVIRFRLLSRSLSTTLLMLNLISRAFIARPSVSYICFAVILLYSLGFLCAAFL
jgi:hypothetical protein